MVLLHQTSKGDINAHVHSALFVALDSSRHDRRDDRRVRNSNGPVQRRPRRLQVVGVRIPDPAAHHRPDLSGQHRPRRCGQMEPARRERPLAPMGEDLSVD